jgi:hypothetical protein
MRNLIVESLEEIFNGYPVSAKRKLIDYSAKFESLWQGSVLDIFGEANIILVVETDTLGTATYQNSLYTSHLRALDWVLAKTREIKADQLIPHIIVFDARTASASDFNYAEDILARVNRTETNKLLIKFFNRQNKGPENLIEYLFRETAHEHFNCSHSARAKISRFWLRELADSDDRAGHHALNNKLGPLAIAAQLPNKDAAVEEIINADKANAAARRAMVSALRSMSILKHQVSPIPMPDLLQHFKLTPHEELRILVLDDQINDGWIPALSYFFNLTPSDLVAVDDAAPFKKVASNHATDNRVSLWIAEHANAVLQKLPPSPQNNLQLTQSNGGAKHREVLLLDLRLFANENGTNAGERNFLNSVLHKLGEVHANDVTSPNETTKYLRDLTALARYISTIDHTYPIALWSSSSQKEVYESVKDYRNISTCLSKPRFDHYSEDSIETFRLQLEQAIKELAHVSETAKYLSILFTNPNTTTDLTNHTHIALYVDETGKTTDSKFLIGGTLAKFIAPTKSAALLLVDELNLRLTSDGFKYFPDIQSKDLTGVLPKGQEWTPNISAASTSNSLKNLLLNLRNSASAISEHGKVIDLHPIFIADDGKRKELNSSQGIASTDTRYWSMLDALLEIFIFEIAAMEQKKCKSLSFSIFVSTRSTGRAELEANPDRTQIERFERIKRDQRVLSAKFHLYYSSGGLQTMSPDWLVPLLLGYREKHSQSQWLEYCHEAMALPQLNRKGGMLNGSATLMCDSCKLLKQGSRFKSGWPEFDCGCRSPNLKIRQTPLLKSADCVMDFGGADPITTFVSDEFDGYFFNHKDPKTRLWLKAGRELDRGNLVEGTSLAIEAIKNAGTSEIVESRTTPLSSLKVRLAGKTLTASQFYELLDR